jgi:hypothetical protein
MPKLKRKPFGNAKLDKMQGPLPQLSIIAPDKKNKLRIDNTIQTLHELLKHYKILKDDPEKWFLLSLNLANDYVPAMHFSKKKGRSDKWSWNEELALYSLVNWIKVTKGDQSKLIPQSIKKYIKNSILNKHASDLSTEPKIRRRIDSFLKSDEFKVVKKIYPYLEDPKKHAEKLHYMFFLEPSLNMNPEKISPK